MDHWDHISLPKKAYGSSFFVGLTAMPNTQNHMLHGSETWPVRKENVVALQRAEMRMVRWMCGV